MTTPVRSAREITEELRQLAEQDDARRERIGLLIHEVHIFQEELVVQNEALARVQAALEESRHRFAELYDLAPAGYLTLDPNGIILQTNLTGAAMIGQSRERLEGRPFIGYVRAQDRSAFLSFLMRCRSHTDGSDAFVELMLQVPDGVRDVQLVSKPRLDASGRREYFTSMIDVTERRSLEADRDAAAREHAALASRLISIQEEERQRIARDLHDNIGQRVTALRLLLDVAKAGSKDEPVLHRIRQAQSIVDQLDSRLDFLTSELRPVALDLGAVLAIEQFVNEWSDTFGVLVEFECAGVQNLRLKPDVETHLYRVVQEALNNVAKHAAAKHVRVELARRATLLVLTISDDGCGFDPSERARALNGGLGLLSMRERALIINGTIDVHSVPGWGTTIALQVPTASWLADTT